MKKVEQNTNSKLSDPLYHRKGIRKCCQLAKKEKNVCFHIHQNAYRRSIILAVSRHKNHRNKFLFSYVTTLKGKNFLPLGPNSIFKGSPEDSKFIPFKSKPFSQRKKHYHHSFKHVQWVRRVLSSKPSLY